MIGDIARLTALMAPLRDDLLAAQKAENRAELALGNARYHRQLAERELAQIEAEFAKRIIAQVRPADDADSEFVAFEDADDLIGALTKGDFR
jgi:DICT domain-containing protein